MNNHFLRNPTLTAYEAFLSNHRGGIVFRNLKSAILSALVVLILGVPVIVGIRLAFRGNKLLSIFEAGLVLPLLYSQALRLHTLKLLISETGFFGEIYTATIPDRIARSFPLIYSDVGVVIGLCFSYSPLLLLPVIQMLKATGDDLVRAALDLGVSKFRIALLLLRHARSGLVAGLILMVVVAWFSSLEYEILGTQPSILSMLEDLVGVEKYPEAFAFALAPFAAAALGLTVVVAWCKPERLLGVGNDDEH